MVLLPINFLTLEICLYFDTIVYSCSYSNWAEIPVVTLLHIFVLFLIEQLHDPSSSTSCDLPPKSMFMQVGNFPLIIVPWETCRFESLYHLRSAKLLFDLLYSTFWAPETLGAEFIPQQALQEVLSWCLKFNLKCQKWIWQSLNLR